MIGAYYYDRCIGERTTQHNTIKKKKKKKKKKRNVYTCVCLHSTFNDGHDPSVVAGIVPPFGWWWWGIEISARRVRTRSRRDYKDRRELQM
jgi:hypothetical protein